jgi:ribosomal protein L37AE/L43A
MSKKKEVYNSFEDYAIAMGYKPLNRVTKDKNKLQSQRNAFLEKHKCRACGEPMVWVAGTSIMSCRNPECKGLRIKMKDDNGKSYVVKKPSYYVLDEIGVEIANNIFKEDK